MSNQNSPEEELNPELNDSQKESGDSGPEPRPEISADTPIDNETHSHQPPDAAPVESSETPEPVEHSSDGAAPEVPLTADTKEQEAEKTAGSLTDIEQILNSDEPAAEPAPARDEVIDELAHIIESLIFASDEPIPVSQIKLVIDASHSFGRINPDMITARVDELNAKYDADGTGFRIVEIANGFQYATRKEMAQWVSILFKERAKRRLSNSALESLAIIAYKQPVTKPEIEAIRGVNVDYVLHSLLEKELVTVVGRADTVGRPLLYGTTQKFLKLFALKNLEDLPKLREIDEIIREIRSKGAEESIQLEITALTEQPVQETRTDTAEGHDAQPTNGTPGE